MTQAYADLSFYVTQYLCGRKEAIDTTSFDFYAKKATAKLRSVINNEPEIIPDSLKLCCCEIAEILYEAEQQSTGVSAESVGGWSRSFESSEAIVANADKKIGRSIRTWLCDTGLLFAGVG